MEEQDCPKMLLLQPLSVLVIILFHSATVNTAKSQDDKMVFSRSSYPSLQEQELLSKRSIRWYNGRPGKTWFINRLSKLHPLAPALVPVWCQGNRIEQEQEQEQDSWQEPEPEPELSTMVGPKGTKFRIFFGSG